MDRFSSNEEMNKKIQEQIQKTQNKIDTTPTAGPAKKKKPMRMVTAKRRE